MLSCLTLLVLTTCKPNYEKIFKENNDNFEIHRPKFNNVIEDIETKYVSVWDGQEIVVSIESLNEQSKKTLKELGVGSIEITRNSNDNCEKNYSIALNVIEDWNIRALRVVQLVFAPCEKNAEKYYHYFDGYHRDIWGQGGNWFIYSDTDLF